MGERGQPVFIGPVGVGKSSVSTIVAEILAVPRVELDEIAMPYYQACPEFDPDTYDRLPGTRGFVTAYRYWEPALAFAVEHASSDRSPSAARGRRRLGQRGNRRRVRCG